MSARKKNPKKRDSVSWRFGVMNAAFFILMATVLLSVFNYVTANITDATSKDYARFYSMDAVHKLSIYMNHEIELVAKVAGSPKLVDWFADEGNAEKKKAALEELFVYGDLLFSSELYFVIHGSLNEYSIDLKKKPSVSAVKPFDTINPKLEYDQWYYRAIRSENDYELNIDVDKVTNERRLWLNYKVTRFGRTHGVFSSGLRFDDVAARLFNLQDTGSVKSVIINEKGIVQMNSHLLARSDLPPHVEGLHVSELRSDPEFLFEMKKYLDGIVGVFTAEDEPVIFKTRSGSHRYVSIAPIAHTNWTVVTFFNSESLYDPAKFFPLFAAALIALFLCAIFISSLSRRLVFTPFKKLMNNIDRNIWSAQSSGSGLQNEFGEIFKTIEYAQMLFDSTPLSCTLWDGEANIIECNNAAVRLFNMSSKREYLDKFYELSPPKQPCGSDSAELAKELIKRALSEGYVSFDWTHRRLDGEEIPCEITLVRVKHRDEYHVVGYSRDLREYMAYVGEIEKAQESMRAARDAAESANRAKSVFLANMSHEIRTPMNSIIGFSELALDGDNPPKTKEYLSKISDSAMWLLEIINDILDISKIESGKVELERIPFDLQQVFDDCQAAISPDAHEKGLALYCYNELSDVKMLIGDPVRLRQALFNILTNAVKFTNIGMIKFLASVVDSSEDSVTVYFEIKDSGIGMSSEQVERVFEPFTQADNSVTRKFGGTGLGLTITRDIIEMMGGKLTAESVPDVGSKFSFELTFGVVNDEEAAGILRKTAQYDLEKPSFSGEILVCEDNLMNQQVICENLEKVGITPVVAKNGKEGVDLVSRRAENGEKPFGLIFMDIHMPVMDGLEAASKISRLGVPTPIVAMTANIMSGDIELYKKNGMSDSLGKPFTSQELWKCLMKYFPVTAVTAVEKAQLDAEDDRMLTRLKLNFAKSNRTIGSDIAKAISDGDLKIAHRLAHTLKSNAGQIGEKRLQEAAAAVEEALADGENRLAGSETANLDAALKSTLEELAGLFDESAVRTEPMTDGEIDEMFGRLEGMLQNRNPECMNLLADVRSIRGAEELARLIEDFEFKQAAEELTKLKRAMGKQ